MKHIRNKCCDYCSDKPTFNTITALKCHLVQHHYVNGNRCPFCHEIFTKNAPVGTILKHISRYHEPKKRKTNVGKGNRNKICDYCRDRPTFGTFTALKTHLFLEHYEEAIRCGFCFEVFVKSVPFNTIQKHYSRYHKHEPHYKGILEAHKSDVEKNCVELSSDV